MVLIETYWNVNIIVIMDNALCTSVLIETYWNVNRIQNDTKAYGTWY